MENMDKYIRNRITELRMVKEVSEYKMSYDLGHSRGYINNISSGKSMPSLTEFLAICDYFDITPSDFFNESCKNPMLVSEILDEIQEMDEEDLRLVLDLIKRMQRK
jgi:DNA-binding XRE family transcriptional regulator